MKKIFLFCVVSLTIIGCTKQNATTQIPAENGEDTLCTQGENGGIISFFGKDLKLNDSVFEQISIIASEDECLSMNDKIIQIANVKWGVNVHDNSLVLCSSIEPDDPLMGEVISYINSKYGEPYDDEEDYNYHWSSSNDTLDIFKPGCTLIHLRRIRSEEGGTVLVIQ